MSEDNDGPWVRYDDALAARATVVYQLVEEETKHASTRRRLEDATRLLQAQVTHQTNLRNELKTVKAHLGKVMSENEALKKRLGGG